jgi:hypothetical protein
MSRITLARWCRMSRSTVRYAERITSPARCNLRQREKRRRRAQELVRSILGPMAKET